MDFRYIPFDTILVVVVPCPDLPFDINHRTFFDIPLYKLRTLTIGYDIVPFCPLGDFRSVRKFISALVGGQ